MLRKLVTALVLIPLAMLIIAFEVANRHRVVVTLDPFDQAHPAFAVAVPLFELLLGVAIGGVILGGVAAWIKQAKWRRAARLAQTQARALAAELDRLKEQAREPSQSDNPVVRSGYQPRLTIPPPAA